MRFAWMAQRALSGDATVPTARDVVADATLEAARSLGLDAEIGSIQPGKQADLAAVSLAASRCIPAYEPHATLVSCDPSDVVLTMVAGEVLFDGTEIVTIDEPRIAARCRERADLIASALTGRPASPGVRPVPQRR
jgi:5-methylthioadenosine/S-adenosylhomocysteine deaminase